MDGLRKQFFILALGERFNSLLIPDAITKGKKEIIDHSEYLNYCYVEHVIGLVELFGLGEYETRPFYNQALNMGDFITNMESTISEILPSTLNEDLAIRYVKRITQYELDKAAREKGYSNIISACSYATSAGSYGTEGQAFVNWRDATWTYLFQKIEELKANAPISVTQVHDVLLTLPKY